MMANKAKKWPWFTALILCICVFVATLAITVIRLQQTDVPQASDPLQIQYEKLFSDPNWAELYALSNASISEFENVDTVADYLRNKVADKELTLYDMIDLDPDAYSFTVYCEDQRIASFSLSKSDWSLHHLYLELDRSVCVKVQVPLGITVYLNGIPVGDEYLSYTMETKAERYLPEGIHGVRARGYMVYDLLMDPEVTAFDENGQPVALLYDEVNDLYYVQGNLPTQITDQQRAFVAGAASADAMYALARISNQELANFFDSKSDLYHMLTDNPRNLQKFTSATVEDVTVSQFCQYSETLFSANVTLTQKIIRTSGTLKTYYLDKTYFFELKDNGEYRVIAYTNEHVTEKVEKVQLIYNLPSGEMIKQMVDIQAVSVEVPEPGDYPALLGWATKTQYEENKVLIHVRILPDGTVLGGLAPMVLYPHFPTE